MKTMLCLGFASMLSGCVVANARMPHTGHLFVALTDRESGRPITNATVTVRTQTEFNLGRTLESHFTKTSAQSDSNGVAHVLFTFYDSDFTWRVDAPSHFNGRFGSGYGREEFGRIAEDSDYMGIDTNTVQGLAMYNELVQLYNNDYLGFVAKFNPKSVAYTNSVIHRSVCLTPKHNPQPMYAYGGCAMDFLPMADPTPIETNGVEVMRYKPVDFDMKDNLRLPTKANYQRRLHTPAGHVSDFHIERFYMNTNGVETQYGWIEFAPGCGAYKRHTTGDPSFPTTYEADTNEVFLTRIPFEISSVSGQVVHVQRLLDEDEYMVLRTRVETNGAGEVTSCNYSKILGPLEIWDRIYFTSLIFNPRPNDSNLEFDTDNNLATRDPCNWYP